MMRNSTIVSTQEPMNIRAFVAAARNEAGEALPAHIEFEVGGRPLVSRPLRSYRDIAIAEQLLSTPRRIHLMAAEMEDRTVRGILFVALPKNGNEDADTLGPDLDEECFTLGDAEIDAEIRQAGDFINDAKMLLSVLTFSDVVDREEEAAIERLIRESAGES